MWNRNTKTFLNKSVIEGDFGMPICDFLILDNEYKYFSYYRNRMEGDTTYTSIITYNHFEVKADNGIHGTIRNVNESSLHNFFSGG